MTQEDFNKAIDIIARHHSTTVHIDGTLNHFVGNIGSMNYTVHISKCAPSLIKDFVQNGYQLEMNANGLRVDKI